MSRVDKAPCAASTERQNDKVDTLRRFTLQSANPARL